MKKIVLNLLIISIYCGCDANGNEIYITNKTNSTIFLLTNPPLESKWDTSFFYYDSIVASEIKKEGNFTVYAIKPSTDFYIGGNMGNEPSVKAITADDIEIIKNGDTIKLTKEDIINKLENSGNSTKNFFIIK